MPPEVRMFWTKRLKEAEADADGAWVLSYGDLMTLLLVVFVMIAAMSELRTGSRFGRIRDGVRQAFGFAAMTSPVQAKSAVLGHPPTLLERLEQAGFKRESSALLIGPDDEVLAACDVIVARDSIMVRLAGHVMFVPHSAAIESGGAKAVSRIGEFLADGTSRIEVRGYGEAGPLPAHVPFRDAMDLSYARARAVVDLFAAKDVERSRMFIAALGEGGSGTHGEQGEAGLSGSTETLAAVSPDDASRRIEILVHAPSTGGHSLMDRREGQD
jgi:chemotaxis protein MotB